MKKLKQVIDQIKNLPAENTDELEQLLWPYLCYSPKLPLRLGQQQLLQDAETATLKVHDEFFACRELAFNAFRWGNGTFKVLLTHGWGSKAADFNEVITALSTFEDLSIIAFDAPGTGSSEGEFSNLLLFKLAVKAVVKQYGNPDLLIGHSLGAMANVFALRDMEFMPSLLISITPLVRLQENFEASMDALNISSANQAAFFESFQEKFRVSASSFTLDHLYDFNDQLNHWLAFDSSDDIAPYPYLQEFLAHHPTIRASDYKDVGHSKAIKSPEIIADILAKVESIKYRTMN
jgi:pimeloyl-ACP methyl ester carboxylesterase